MLVFVNNNLEGYKIKEHINMVVGTGNSAKDGDAFRNVAIQKAFEQAEKLGANAIINAGLSINVINNTMEATVYGDAVIIESLLNKNFTTEQKPVKINLDSYIPKQHNDDIETGEIVDLNGYKFVVCPKCKSKYKADINEKGEIQIKGFDDVDDAEPGLQVFCLRCGTKFTVPDKL